MENKENNLETLLKQAGEYGQSVYELVKLKILDKSLDVVSSLITHYVVWIMLVLFLVFSSLGLAWVLGDIMGAIYYGFFVLAAFYCFVAIILHKVIRKWFKKVISNYIIKHEIK